MQKDLEYLKSIYKKNIENKIAELDCSTSQSRNKVYSSAIIAQKKINDTSSNISDSAKKERLATLIGIIESTEKKLNSSDNIPHDKYETSRRSKKHLVYCLVLFLSAMATAIYFLQQSDLDVKDGIKSKLPVEFVFSDKVFKTVVVRGVGKITKSEGKPQFIYSLENTKQEELQAVDAIFRDADFVKKLQSIKDPVLLTLQLQKLSDTPINIEIMAFGIGATSRQKFRIYDNNINQINLVANLKEAKNRRKNILIRLSVKPDGTSDHSKVEVLFKKISFIEL